MAFAYRVVFLVMVFNVAFSPCSYAGAVADPIINDVLQILTARINSHTEFLNSLESGFSSEEEKNLFFFEDENKLNFSIKDQELFNIYIKSMRDFKSHLVMRYGILSELLRAELNEPVKSDMNPGPLSAVKGLLKQVMDALQEFQDFHKSAPDFLDIIKLSSVYGLIASEKLPSLNEEKSPSLKFLNSSLKRVFFEICSNCDFPEIHDEGLFLDHLLKVIVNKAGPRVVVREMADSTLRNRLSTEIFGLQNTFDDLSPTVDHILSKNHKIYSEYHSGWVEVNVKFHEYSRLYYQFYDLFCSIIKYTSQYSSEFVKKEQSFYNRYFFNFYISKLSSIPPLFISEVLMSMKSLKGMASKMRREILMSSQHKNKKNKKTNSRVHQTAQDKKMTHTAASAVLEECETLDQVCVQSPACEQESTSPLVVEGVAPQSDSGRSFVSDEGEIASSMLVAEEIFSVFRQKKYSPKSLLLGSSVETDNESAASARFLKLKDQFMHTSARNQLKSLFEESITFEDLEVLTRRAGGRIKMNKGSHFTLELPGGLAFPWRPHGGAVRFKSHALRLIRNAFSDAGVTPENLGF